MIKTVTEKHRDLDKSKKIALALLLVLALLAFELFNFDTTRYALHNFLGEISFLGVSWATILAIAFCAIDFAGLAHLFTPQKGREEPGAVWYLMGAWLLGATMNALMTWWAVSLTLLSHGGVGNEVLSREQLLHVVPIFVAALVWLTRILFIGALSVAGDHLVDASSTNPRLGEVVGRPETAALGVRPPAPALSQASSAVSGPRATHTRRAPAVPSRPVRRRPPMPMPSQVRQVPVALRARGRY